VLRSFARTCLLLFVSEAPAYGYDLLERLQALMGHTYDPGTIYRSLHCLEEQGFLRSRWAPSDQGGPDRRVYMLTDRGMEALHADADALRRDESALESFFERYEQLYEDPPAAEPLEARRAAR
jgi:PadR family transcriptional regulator PadR